MASYQPAGQLAPSTVQPLPVRRREPTQSQVASPASGAAPSQPWQTAPQWPKAPEQPADTPRPRTNALFGPVPPKVSPFGIATEQPGASPSLPEMPTASSVAPPQPLWTSQVPQVPQAQPVSPPSMPLKALLQPAAPPPAQAPWPSFGEVQPQPDSIWTETPLSHFPPVTAEPTSPPEPETPPSSIHVSPWTWALLTLLLLVPAWLSWEDMREDWAREFPTPKPPTTQEPQSPPSPIPEVPTTAEPPPVPPVPPEPEVRRAQVPDAEEMAALHPSPELLAQTQSLLQALLAAPDAASRLSLLAMPEDHTIEVAEFFAEGSPTLGSVALASATPLTLPGGKPVPLFQVFTDRCPAGALLKLAARGTGELLLDWPLFAETHQRRLANFIENQPENPAWHHVGLRRSHGLDLPAEIRERHLVFDLQGSADGSVRCIAIAARETPLGRFLESETTWGKVYLARLLLQHRQAGSEEALPHILDCEGARTGATQP